MPTMATPSGQGLVSYSLDEETQVATLVMDDGKAQAVSFELCRALHAALDRAEKAEAGVVLTGSRRVFCAGFHLQTLLNAKTGADLLKEGFVLSQRMLHFPYPLVVACNGHALAMGAFLCLSADYRIGTEGRFKIAANEVAIGLTMPHFAVELLRLRINKSHLQRAGCLSETFSPAGAVEAGFLDQVVSKEELLGTAQRKAAELMKLDMNALQGTKLRMRPKDVLVAAREQDDKELRAHL